MTYQKGANPDIDDRIQAELERIIPEWNVWEKEPVNGHYYMKAGEYAATFQNTTGVSFPRIKFVFSFEDTNGTSLQKVDDRIQHRVCAYDGLYRRRDGVGGCICDLFLPDRFPGTQVFYVACTAWLVCPHPGQRHFVRRGGARLLHTAALRQSAAAGVCHRSWCRCVCSLPDSFGRGQRRARLVFTKTQTAIKKTRDMSRVFYFSSGQNSSSTVVPSTRAS